MNDFFQKNVFGEKLDEKPPLEWDEKMLLRIALTQTF